MPNRRWTRAILAGWAGLISLAYLDERARALTPASRFFEVSDVHVYDTFEGDAPILSVSREIKREFSGTWLATVRNVSDRTLSFACLASGQADYKPGVRLPAQVTLDWWTFPTRCALSPGRYRLDTVWTIQPDGYPDKAVRSVSNNFEVFAAPWRQQAPQ